MRSIVDVRDFRLMGLTGDIHENRGPRADIARRAIARREHQLGVERTLEIQILGDRQGNIGSQLLREQERSLRTRKGERTQSAPPCLRQVSRQLRVKLTLRSTGAHPNQPAWNGQE
ncbi:hypothetical protein GCM10027068_15300 [Prescottella soli]